MPLALGLFGIYGPDNSWLLLYLVAPVVLLYISLLPLTTWLLRLGFRLLGTDRFRDDSRFMRWPLSLPPSLFIYLLIARTVVAYSHPELTPEQYVALKSITPGMSMQEVVALAGEPPYRDSRPDHTSFWQYQDGFGGGHWNVEFAGERVIERAWSDLQ